MTDRPQAQRAAGSAAPPWMLYGAAGYTGTLIAQHAHERGHRPVLAGRNAPSIKRASPAIAKRSGLIHLFR